MKTIDNVLINVNEKSNYLKYASLTKITGQLIKIYTLY